MAEKIVDKGLRGYQTWNKIELAGEVGAAGIAVAIGSAALLGAAVTLGTINLIQMGAIHGIQESRKGGSSSKETKTSSRDSKWYSPRHWWGKK